MSLFSIFSGTPKAETVLIFDIGSASVGGALLALEPGKKPKMIRTTRANIVFQEELNFSRFTRAMLEAVDKVVAELTKEKVRTPRTCICSLASPWYISETKKVNITKDRPFTVTKEYIDEMVRHEESLFRSKYAGGEKDKKNGKKSVEVIETEAINIRLNGYEVDDPYEKEAKQIDLAVYMSISQGQVVDALKSHIRQGLNYDHIMFHSFSLVSFSVIRNVVPALSSFLFIDVTGEVTDVTLIKDNTLLDTVSFPLGKNFIIRRLSSSMRVSPREAESLFDLYSGGKAERKTAERIEHVLAQTKKDWTDSFSKALTGFENALSLPHHIFLTADIDVKEWFADAVGQEEFGQFSSADHKFEVRLLGEELLEHFIDHNPGVVRDLFLMVGGVFGGTILGATTEE